MKIIDLRKVVAYTQTEFSTAWKVSKYGVFSGPYFPVFSSNTGKYGPEKPRYLDIFHAVFITQCLWFDEISYEIALWYLETAAGRCSSK